MSSSVTLLGFVSTRVGFGAGGYGLSKFTFSGWKIWYIKKTQKKLKLQTCNLVKKIYVQYRAIIPSSWNLFYPVTRSWRIELSECKTFATKFLLQKFTPTKDSNQEKAHRVRVLLRDLFFGNGLDVSNVTTFHLIFLLLPILLIKNSPPLLICSILHFLFFPLNWSRKKRRNHQL